LEKKNKKFETKKHTPPPNSLTIYKTGEHFLVPLVLLIVRGVCGQEREILILHTEIEKAAADRKGD
jgi:hypothetical protein